MEELKLDIQKKKNIKKRVSILSLFEKHIILHKSLTKSLTTMDRVFFDVFSECIIPTVLICIILEYCVDVMDVIITFNMDTYRYLYICDGLFRYELILNEVNNDILVQCLRIYKLFANSFYHYTISTIKTGESHSFVFGNIFNAIFQLICPQHKTNINFIYNGNYHYSPTNVENVLLNKTKKMIASQIVNITELNNYYIIEEYNRLRSDWYGLILIHKENTIYDSIITLHHIIKYLYGLSLFKPTKISDYLNISISSI